MDQNANATQQQKDFSNNDVRFQGYLKSSKLAVKQTQQNTDYIGGDIIVAITAAQSLVVRCFAYKYSNSQNGAQTINPGYERLAKFLPTSGDSGIVSIASATAKNPELTFDQAMAQATKVYGYGALEENGFYAKDGTEVSRTRIKASFFDVSSVTTGFVPYNRFSIKLFIRAIQEDPNTKRVHIGGFYPSYKGVMNKIVLVTPAPTDATTIANGAKVGDFAQVAHDYILANYKPGCTATLVGYISDIRVVKAPQEPVSDNPFLAIAAPTMPTSTFEHENIVYGGFEPIADGAEGSITAKAVQTGLAMREAQMGPHQPAQPKAAAPAAAPAPTPAPKPAAAKAAPAAQQGFGGFDFDPKAAAASVPPVSPEVAKAVEGFTF